MQSASTALQNAIANSTSVYTQPKVILEWNMNVSGTVLEVGNSGDDPGADPDFYPIESISWANRPIGGMAKPRINHAKVTKFGSASQYRMIGDQSIYKYWMTERVSTPSFHVLTGVSPYIYYAAPVLVNRILIKTENSEAYPVLSTIETTLDGTTWTTIATNPTVASDGTISIYLQNNGTWSNTYNDANSKLIRSIRFNVTSVSTSWAHFSLIELSGRLVQDVTNDVIDVNVTKQMANPDLAHPVGIVGTNSCSITLDNSGGKYNNDNVTSKYYNILTKNVKATIYYGINPTDFSKTNLEYIKQGSFYIDSWGNQTDTSVSISATDFTKFLEGQHLIPTVLKNKTAGQCIQYILNTIGFNNISFYGPNKNDYVIPYMWFKDTDMAWDIIQQICTVAQAALFVDENGNFQYVSNDAFLDSNFSSVYELRGQQNGNGLANIIDMDHEFNVQVNRVTVNYKTLSINRDNFGRFLSSALWQPTDQSSFTNSEGRQINLSNNYTAGDAISIMSGYLTENMSTNQMYIKIEPKYLPEWPFTGYMNVNGEIMRYSGMTYKYYPTNDLHNPSYDIVYSLDDVTRINNNKTNQYMRKYNGYTGKVYLTERGAWGSQQVAHNIKITGWSTYHTYTNQNKGKGKDSYDAVDNYRSAVSQDRSTMRLQGKGSKKEANMTFSVSPAGSGTYAVAGTQIYFPHQGNVYTSGGLFFNLQNDNQKGMFVELSTSKKAKNKKVRELRLIKKANVGGKMVETELDKVKLTISNESWHTIDVTFDSVNSVYNIYVDGNLRISNTDNTWSSGSFGVWVRADSVAKFEYCYGANDYDKSYPPEHSTFLDKITGDYISNFVEKNLVYGKRYNKEKKRHQNIVLDFFDDFGPYAHEIREFNVLYQITPALSASMYFSNDRYLELIDFVSNPFGAKFYFANKNRAQIGDAGLGVLQGTDVDYYGAKNPVSQTAQISGYVLTSSDQKTVIHGNALSIEAYGVNELTFDSQWIQTKGMAEQVADWCVLYWSEPVETLTSNVWVNPCLQLIDNINVNYAAKSMTNEHFNITEIQTGWANGGMTQNLTLQKTLTPAPKYRPL